ncbi:Ig-like domain repeat protein [bacterium]|nr:Ig-like domain repeat protein [bacterium]
MNMKRIGILGLIAVMGMFWGCALVEAAVETVCAYRAYDDNLGPVDEATIFGTNYNAVYVVATCTGMTGGTCTGTASVAGGATKIINLRDDGIYPDIRANDGIYTAPQFTISRKGGADLAVGNGQSFSVSVDIDGVDGPGVANLMAEYIAPGFVILPYVTKTSIPLDGTTAICFTAKDDIQNGTWTYSVMIDNQLLSGSSTGTCTGQTSINMIWDGRDKNGDIFPSGEYNMNIKIVDEAGNFCENSMATVMLDAESPKTTGGIIVSPYSCFSTDTGKKSVTISFEGSDNADVWAYSFSCNGQLLFGAGASGTRTTKQMINFVWDGRYGTGTMLPPGQHEIVLELRDSVGNIRNEKVYITIDNTAPAMENLQFSGNFASSKQPLIISFTGVESTGQWTYEITIGGQEPRGTQGTSPSGTSFLSSEPISFIWPAIDKNGAPFAEGDHVVEITLTDLAGNIKKATSLVKVDGMSPSLTNLTVSSPYFSPYGSPSTNNISFNGKDNLGTWTYSISINGILLDGTPSSAGTSSSAGTISFAWNGKNIWGDYPSGLTTITVQLMDMGGNTSIGSTTVTFDIIAPEILSASVSDYSFSLEGDKRSTTIEFTAADNADMWSYTLVVDGTNTPVGTGSPTGTFTGTGTIQFVWDGRYVNGTATDGPHTFTITVVDRMGNFSTENFLIAVDIIPPQIKGIKENTYGTVKYMDEEILFNLEADSFGEADVLLTSQEIQSAEDVIKGAEYIRMQDGWRQFEGDIVGGAISVYVAANGSEGTWTSFAITDNYTTVQGLIDAINTIAFATSTFGSMTYDSTTDKFTIRAASGYSVGLREYCLEANRAPFFTSAKLFCGYVSLYSIGGNKYQGKYLVPQTAGTVSCSIVGLFKDNGGNRATNYGTASGTVSLNGQKKMAYENVKIIGLRVEPDPSKQVFNTMNKRITFNLIAGEIDKEIKESASFVHQDGTVTIQSPEINAGDNIIVWNDGLGSGTTHGRVWKMIAGSNGTVSITNNNLCFGESLPSYDSVSLKDSYFHVAKGVVLRRGVPSISFDLGSIENNILLYDDGNDAAHHDMGEGDSIFSGFYELPDGLELSDVPVFAHLRVTNEKTVANDGYPFNDEERLPFSSSNYSAADTKPLNNIYIDMDTIKPVVTLLGSTVPFNPETGKKCEIKYTLTKTLVADVRVVIKDGYLPGANIIKDLGVQTAKTDNVCYWQGDFENGELVPDASYYYFIYATDQAGNKAEEIFGVTKVSRVQVDLVEVKVTAAKTITGNVGEGSTYVNIAIDCMLKGSQAQLQNLEFDTSQTINVFNRPHALFRIAFFDKNSNLIYIAPDDWDTTIDTDPFPCGLPNYVKRGEGSLEYRGNTYRVDDCIHLGNQLLLDKWDDNKGNDFDTLVPFDRISPTDENEKEYHAKFKCAVDFKSCGIKLNPGSYFVRIYTELMAAEWKFIDHEKSMSGDYIAEKWHYRPDSSHYGLATGYKDYRFEVVGSDLPTLDNKSPDVYESSPCDKGEVKQKEIRSGEENKEQGVWVRVGDQGIGVDFSISNIILLGPNGLEVSGSPMSNGNDKLYWVIDKVKYPEGLSIPGEYTIRITVYDKAKNLTEVIRKFTVIDEMPPEVRMEILPEKDIYEGQSIVLRGSVSEYDTGGSIVDQAKSTIILKDEQKEIPVRVKIQETDKKYISMTVELPNGLLAGTYTVQVIGYDASGNKAVVEKSFIVLKGISVFFCHPVLGTVTAMNIIPGSRIYYSGTSTEIGTNTLIVKQLSTVGTITGFASFGVPIEIFMGTVSLKDCIIDKDVMLKLYYTNAESQSLSGKAIENDLRLYGANNNKWEQIIGAVVDPQGNQVSYQITSGTAIMGSYTMVYSTVGDITLRMSWENDASTIWMFVPGSATANGIPVAGCTRTVTAVGTASIPAAPEGYKILSPVVLFRFNEAAIVAFSENVKIKLHYNLSKLPAGVNEGDLIVYGYSGGKWNPLTQKGDAGKIEANTIILTTNATKEMYAIMYKSPDVIISEGKAAAGFKESAHCYPNPARGKVTFACNLVFKSKITIKVYTLLGDLVWEDTHTQDSGVDRTSPLWNCCNTAGEMIASGVYFYRMTMEPEDGSAAATVTKKLIVIQ